MGDLFDRIFRPHTTMSETQTRGYAAQPVHSDVPRAFMPGSNRTSSVSVNESLGLTAVYRCVSILTTLASTLDIEAMRVGRPVLNQPAIVRRPNLYQPRRTFIQETTTSLALYGEAFWLLARNSVLETPNNIEVLHPSQVNVRRDETGRIVYELSSDGKWRTLAPHEIQHLKLFRIPGALHGLGPIQSCRSAVRLGLDQEDYAGTWFSTTEVPEGILSTPQEITREQAQAAGDAWTTARTERNTAVLGNGLSYQTVSVSPKDALFVEASELSTIQIARMFGVPGTLLDAPGDSATYANQLQKNQALLDTGLRPYLDEIESAFDEILPLGTTARFRIEELLALDEQTRAATDQILIQSGVRTVDEIRERDGLDPLPEKTPEPTPTGEQTPVEVVPND